MMPTEPISVGADVRVVHIATPGLQGPPGDVSSEQLASAVEAHRVDTTDVHGIADTAALATDAEVASAVEAHRADTTQVHGIADTAALATTASVTSAVEAHRTDTTDVHGIADTAQVALKTGPTFTAVTPAPVMSANLAPGLSGWTLDGSAVYQASPEQISIGPGAGGMQFTLDGVVSGAVYQVDLTTTSSSGGTWTFAVGTDSTAYLPSTYSLTVVATGSGSLVVRVSGATWSAVITGITVRRLVTPVSPVVTAGSYQIRAFSSNLLSNQGSSITTGSGNVGLGYYALQSPRGVAANATTSGSNQVAIGGNSGQSSSAPTNGGVAVGFYSTFGAHGAVAVGLYSRSDHAGSVALGSDTATTATNQVMIGPRDLESTDATKGIVLKSPDGNRWRVRVANGGTLTVTAA